MSLTKKIKKLRSRLGRGSNAPSSGAKLKRSQGTRNVLSSRAAAHRERADAGADLKPYTPSRLGGGSNAPSSGAKLKRSQGTRNVQPGRSTARRERAEAGADLKPYAPPKVVKPPALQRSHATRDVDKPGQSPARSRQPKRELATGRTVFPVDAGGGKIRYVPLAGEATPHERRLGLFVDAKSVRKEPVNRLLPAGKSVTDLGSERTLFATERADGKTEYLPKESDATALELSQGKFVRDNLVEAQPSGNAVLDKAPLFEFANQRPLYATRASDGSTEYLPKRENATALELKDGNYIDDDPIREQAPLGELNAMSNQPPRFDIGKDRKVYAVKTKDGKTLYLPRESEASALELLRGLYISDDTVDRHERKRRRTALKGDDAEHALRRARRADKLAGGVTAKNIDTRPEPVTRAKDGTEIWDGASLPQVSEKKQRETLKNLRPKYDLGKERMLYPVATAKGKTEYLPLLADATHDERIDGRYAAFVPPEPLADFLANEQQQTFDTELGEVKAYSLEDIADAFESAPTLVLRSAELAGAAARQTPELQQQWM